MVDGGEGCLIAKGLAVQIMVHFVSDVVSLCNTVVAAHVAYHQKSECGVNE